MPGIVIWDAVRDDHLRAAVRLNGRRWGLVAVADAPIVLPAIVGAEINL